MKKIDKVLVERAKYLYVEEERTIKYIHNETGLPIYKIGQILKENGIKTRHGGFKKGDVPKNKIEISDGDKQIISENFSNHVPISKIAEIISKPKRVVKSALRQMKLSNKPVNIYDDTKDKEIIDLYSSGKSITEIGKLLKMKSERVRRHLIHCGVERRTRTEANFALNGKTPPKELNDRDKLYDLYVVQKKSVRKICSMYDVCQDYIFKQLRKFNIPVRDHSEAIKGVFSGSKHPNWQGGKSGLYARVRKFISLEQVPLVLKRDGYVCQCEDCNSNKKLEVHHIIPFKNIFNDILAENHVTEETLEEREEELFDTIVTDKRILDLDNLVTYCRNCHLFKIHGFIKGGKRNKKKDD